MKNPFDQELAKLGFNQKVNSFTAFANSILPDSNSLLYSRSGDPNLELLIFQGPHGVSLSIDSNPVNEKFYFHPPGLLPEEKVFQLVREYLENQNLI